MKLICIAKKILTGILLSFTILLVGKSSGFCGEGDESVAGTSFGGFPIIFYSDQTSLAGGGGAQIVFSEDSERQTSAIMLLAFITANSQYALQVGGEFYPKDGAYKLTGGTGYQYFPDTFYGIGNNTADEFEDYTLRLFLIAPSIQKRIGKNFYIGPSWGYYNAEIVEVDSSIDGSLISGNFLGSEGGVVSGPGLTVTWDTRNNNMYPTQGNYHQFQVGRMSGTFGSDYNFTGAKFDLRHYRLLSEGKIIASRAVIGIGFDDMPFQMMYSLGGHLRGYKFPRFVDKNMIAFQTEYRKHWFGRFGYIVSGGFGQVASEIGKVSFGDLKPSLGLGLRFALIPEHNVNLRIDLGIGKDDSSFDINLGEAF